MIKKLQKIIDEFYKDVYKKPEDYKVDVNINTNEAIVSYGNPEEKFDKKELAKLIEENFLTAKGGDVKVEIEKVYPEKFDVEKLYKLIIREPEDATVSVSGRKNYTIKSMFMVWRLIKIY